MARIAPWGQLNASTFVKTFGLVLSLGFDTFAVAVGLGMSGLSRRDQYRYGACFAVAEGCMPLIGFLLGQFVASAVGNSHRMQPWCCFSWSECTPCGKPLTTKISEYEPLTSGPSWWSRYRSVSTNSR